MAFPNFFGKQYESASNFLDDLEMAFLVSGRDEEEVKLRAFPLVLKDSAKNWFQNLEPGRKTNWETVKETFLSKYGGLDNPEHLWHRISSLHQATSRTYLTYESQFLRLWAEWEASLAEGERAPNFLKKEKFLAGLFPDLQEKVKGKFPETFEEALQIARVKDRKLEYQAHTSRVEHPQGPTMADERLPPAPTTTPEDPHLELLQRVTNQLDNLSINMVQGVRQQQPQPNNERMPNGPRRQPQRRDYFCYNCGEEGHGMYFCPHPTNFNAQAGRGRQQVTPPRARPPPQIQPQILQNPQMVAQPQVLQRSEAPQPVAEIPPLPNNNEQARGPRRQAQEYHCYNCGENGHGMYYCPHPRRIGNFRGPRDQVSPPRERQQQQPPFPIQQAPPVQIPRSPMQPQSQQSPSPPPPIVPIPPLPIQENRVVNVINLDVKVKSKKEDRGKSLPKDKGKAKVEDVDVLSIKRSRKEEVAISERRERRKSKENGDSSSKKKSKPKRKITTKDLALGESYQPYNLVDDALIHGPKITWPQLLHLASKVRRQWTKMVSTRCVKTKAMGLVSNRNLRDITPALEAYVKGKRVSNVYVDGSAQICDIVEQTMHHLGLKVNAPAPCTTKMTNNAKGEGYPIILGRPWLMEMQDWGTGMLKLQPHQGAKKGKATHIDLRAGKHESLDLGTSLDEFSSSKYFTSREKSIVTEYSDSSQAKIMEVMITNPAMVSSNNILQVKEGFLVDGYNQITGAFMAGQGKEVVLLGETHSPNLDGVYTLKLNKATIEIVIYNEKEAKLFGVNLVVDRFMFSDALLSAKQVKIPWICGSQSLVSQDWKEVKLVKKIIGTQPLLTKEIQGVSTTTSEPPYYEVIANKKLLQVPLSQQRKHWLDTMRLREIEAFPEDPNNRRRWLIRKATRYKNRKEDTHTSLEAIKLFLLNSPLEIQEHIIDRIADTGTVWRTGLTLHICGIRFQRGSTLNDKKAIQLACHLGLVNTLRLIPYLIEVYDDKPSWGVARTISRLSRWAHCLIRSVVPRTIPIVLEEEDKDIVKAQRVSADWYDRYEKKYNLLQPKPLCDEDGWLL
ncbi:hypothetical protein L7F22_041785 [Adiantum nelumboides]|nr:hypothetical protein [Adiantum nelumboides]